MIAKCKMKLPFARLFQEHPNGCFLYMVNLIYQSGKGVDAYDCTATGIDFIPKPKEEINMIGIECQWSFEKQYFWSQKNQQFWP